MKFHAITALLSLLFTLSEGAIPVGRCELAKELKRYGLDGYEGYKLGDWMCMAFHESKFKTGAMGRPRSDGSRDYGIFQIDSRYWCKDGNKPSRNACGKPCSSFIDDDIRDDIECAKKIVRGPKKMNAWLGWIKNCKGKDLSRWTRSCKL